MTKRIAFGHSKGGVTKSTSIVNLAAVAQEFGQNVLVFDSDPQGSSTLLSGITEYEHDAADVFGLTGAPMKASEIAIRSKYGFDVVPAGNNLMSVNDKLFDPSIHVPVMRLKLALDNDPGLEKYDYIFFDLAGDKHKFNTTVLFAVDEIVIPHIPAGLPTNELVNWIDYIDEISKARVNEVGLAPLGVRGIFFNRVNERRIATKFNVKDVVEGLEDLTDQYPIAKTYIPEAAAVQNAESLHVPYVIKSPKETVTAKTRALYNELFASPDIWKH